MSVFRRIRKGQKDNRFTIQFRDHASLVRRVGAFRDKKASDELERGILRLVALRASGAVPDAEAARFLESVPAAVRDSLVAWGIIDQVRAAGGKRIAEHVEDWRGQGNHRQVCQGIDRQD